MQKKKTKILYISRQISKYKALIWHKIDQRQQKRLATEMNLPYVENLYVKSLRNRDIPYKTRLTTFDSQNIKTKQPYTQLSTFDNKYIKTKQLDPRHSKSTKQNSKGVRPKVLPIHSSFKNPYKQVTTDLPPPLPIDEVEHFISEQTFRLRSTPTGFEELISTMILGMIERY